MVTVRDLSEHDDFRLDETDYALVGLRSGRKFRMGDAVRIRVVAANLEKRQLDYHWVADSAVTSLSMGKKSKSAKIEKDTRPSKINRPKKQH